MIGFINSYNNPKSWAMRARKKRFKFLMGKIRSVQLKEMLNNFASSMTYRPMRILDIGGTMGYWKTMGYVEDDDIEITLLNLQKQEVSGNFKSVVADATNLHMYKDREFDLVFSNSVIEHLYTWESQRKMANEVMRVGRNYFIQTPNYWFPLEPHFMVPGFQYLPKSIRVWLISHFSLGHHPKYTKEIARQKVEEVKLLSVGDMKMLFPECSIYKEKFFGLTKSIIAYNI